MKTYEELIKILPKETVEFINTLVPYLDYYCRQDHFLSSSYEAITIKNIKIFYLCLYAGCQKKETEAILSRFGFNKENLKIKPDIANNSNDISQLFAKNNYFLPNYHDELKYVSLLPIDIIYYNINSDIKYNAYRSQIFRGLLPDAPEDISDFKNKVFKYLTQEKEKILNNITTNLYDSNVPMSVISLLNTASIIRSTIYEQDFDKINLSINRNDTDIVPLSILLALFYYTDTESIYNYITYKTLIIKYFENQNINNFSNILEFDFKKQNPDYVAIKKYYIRYIKEGIFNSEKNMVPVTVPNVLVNLFNREFTKSYIIDEVFAQVGKNIDDFKNINDWINKELTKYKLDQENEIKDKLYGDIPKETIDFINFIGKTYQLLQTKLINSHELIKSKNDIATLALLIASMFYETKVGLYFIEHNITLDKIFDLFKINLTKETIDNEIIDINILANDLYDFIYSGYQINVIYEDGKTSRSTLTKNRISNKILNRSNIIEDIFYIFKHEYIDKNTLFDKINDYFEKKENEIKRKKEQERKQLEIEFFKDMSEDTIKVLKKTADRYNTLLRDYNDIYTKEDLKLFAILIAILECSKNLKVNWFKNFAFNITHINDNFKVLAWGFNATDDDIKTLKNDFYPYIFEGFNKDLKPEDITAYDILKNVFNQDLYKSEALENFLQRLDKSYEDFQDLEASYKQYIEEENLKKKKADAIPIISKYNILSGNYLRDVSFTWNIIKEKMTRKELDSKYLKNEDDIVTFSLLFWYLKNDKPLSIFLNKHNITKENLLVSCNLKEKDIISDKINEDYDLVFNCLHKFLAIAKDEVISWYADDFIKKLFNPEINPSALIKNLINNDSEYQKLKIEIETGKDYIYSLSIDERINLLKSTPMDTINLDDIKSIMLYGESLRIHSSYLHDEIPTLIKNSTLDMSLANINNLVNKVYSPKQIEKPKKFFTWLFDGVNPKAQLAIDTEAIENLKVEVDKNISTLMQEIYVFDNIRKYIEIYYEKNSLLYENIKKINEEVEVRFKESDPNTDLVEFSKNNSLKQIIINKINLFATTHVIMQQELIKVNQMIVNHFITINALTMAKNDLLPLVWSELMIDKGLNTEKEATLISKDIMALFQSLLTQNTESAKENIERLKQSSLPTEVIDTINKDIDEYILGIEKSKILEGEIIEPNIEDEGPKLTLNRS